MDGIKLDGLKRIVAAALSVVLLATVSYVIASDSPSSAFDPFVVPAPMTMEGQSATLLPDGRWLFAGGRGAPGVNGSIFTRDFRPADRQLRVPALSTSLIYARQGHSATLLPDGSVFVFGGVDGNGAPVVAAEIIDPLTGEIRVINDTGLRPRKGHVATLLTDGRVMISGGTSSVSAASPDIELWNPDDPASQIARADLVTARTEHMGTLLSDGDALIWGGLDAQGGPLAGGEIFSPKRLASSPIPASNNSLAPLAYASTLPPRVEVTLPARDADDVDVDARLAVRFSTRLTVETVNADSLVVIGPSGPVSGHVVPAGDGLLAFFTPQADYSPDTKYTVFLQGMSDQRGQPLATYVFSFTTRALNAGSNGGHDNRGGSSSGPGGSDGRSPSGAPGAGNGPDTGPGKTEQDKKRDDSQKSPDDDEFEDWIPRAEHRHGKWRVLGLPGEPRVNGPVEIPQRLAAAPGVTALSGRVVRLNGRSLRGVSISLGNSTARTDERGRFLLQNVAEGSHELTVDGGAVLSGMRTYTKHYIQVDVVAKQTTVLRDPIHLARLDPANDIAIPSPAPREIVLTHPGIPGLELHIPKGAVLRTRDGKIVTRLNITPLPVDRVPFAVPDGFPVYFTIQPAGVFVDNSATGSVQGIRVIYPNYLSAAPGTRVLFWNYDPTNVGWQVYGHGTVSANGKQVVPDRGVTQQNLMAFGWGLENTGNAPPEGPNPGDCKDAPKAADPVDCATGLFLHSATDMYVSDTIPIVFSRTYRQGDTISRDLGIGTNHSYGLFLSNPSGAALPSQIDLVLPDGGKARFQWVSGSDVSTVVFKHSNTPSVFQGATLQISTVTHAWELTLQDKTVLIFQPHSPNQLIGIRDRYGNNLTIARSGNNISQITSPHGRTVTFTYDGSNRITQIQDALGRTVVYMYDGFGRLWKVTDQNNQTEQYSYDTANRMITVTDKRGNTMVTNHYDSNGRVSQQDLADGTWYFNYTLDGSGKVIQDDVTDPRGIVRRLTFNSSGYVTQETRALGQPEQQTVTYTRDPTTNLATSIADALGRVTRITYDPQGRPLSMTRLYGTANAVMERVTYDSSFGQVTSYTDPLSHRTQLEYDATGSLTAVTDPLGNVSSAAYDGEGKVISITNALYKTTRIAYDQGDIAAVTDPLGRSTSLLTDIVGRTTSIIDALGNGTRYRYDAMDRPTQITDAQGGVTQITYDEIGNMKTVRDPRNLANHVYTYDARNRLHVYTDPLGRSETYNYDSVGNLVSKIGRRNQTTQYQYDALNRVKLVTYDDGSMLTITWDDVGRRAIFADSLNGTITRTYDELNRLVREVSPQGQVDYQYDAAGRRTQLTVAGQSQPVLYGYDNADRLTTITQGANSVGFTYDAANRSSTTTYPNGVVGSYGFDDADQLTSISYSRSGTAIASGAYTYDAAGRRSSAGGTLVRPILDGILAGTSHDAANRLTTLNGSNLSYDDNGNLTSMPGTGALVWNARDQLTSTGKGSTFAYDALGRMVSRTAGGATTTYAYDGPNQLLANGNIELRGPGLDELYAQVTASGTVSYLVDALGSPAMLTNSSGAVFALYSYGAFGNTIATDPSGAAMSGDTAFKYAGADYDAVDNLYYMRARFYSPGLQRFTQSDPSGIDGGINTYAYAFGDPISFSDPDGLTACLNFVKKLVRLAKNSLNARDLGDTLWSNKYGSFSKDYDGFKPSLTGGGQGYAVKRHVYGHAGAVLKFPAGMGNVVSYGAQVQDGDQAYLPGRTVAEAHAEIADDRAAREVARMLKDYMENKDGRVRKDTPNSCGFITSEQALTEGLTDVLCSK